MCDLRRARVPCFLIEVPRGTLKPRAAERAQTPGSEKGSFPDNILVVEDETSVRSSLSRLLKAKGIQAIAVATADDALARIHRQQIRPDFLICDYNLRGSANGVETVNVLRGALAWNVPAIVMTGDTQSKVVDSIAAPGISVLIKPFLADDLLQHISRLHKEGSDFRQSEPSSALLQTKTRQVAPPRSKSPLQIARSLYSSSAFLPPMVFSLANTASTLRSSRCFSVGSNSGSLRVVSEAGSSVAPP